MSLLTVSLRNLQWSEVPHACTITSTHLTASAVTYSTFSPVTIEQLYIIIFLHSARSCPPACTHVALKNSLGCTLPYRHHPISLYCLQLNFLSFLYFLYFSILAKSNSFPLIFSIHIHIRLLLLWLHTKLLFSRSPMMTTLLYPMVRSHSHTPTFGTMLLNAFWLKCLDTVICFHPFPFNSQTFPSQSLLPSSPFLPHF